MPEGSAMAQPDPDRTRAPCHPVNYVRTLARLSALVSIPIPETLEPAPSVNGAQSFPPATLKVSSIVASHEARR
jgi:hypothetical protein